MAGRPKKKAAQVAALEDKSIELFTELFIAMPSQWAKVAQDLHEGKHTDVRDPTGRLWLTAFIFSQQAMMALESLGNAMRRKAGIDGPSMLRDFADGMFAGCDGHAVESNGTAGVQCDRTGDGQRGLEITPN